MDENNLYAYAIFNLLLTSEFKWIDPKNFDLSKYDKISSKNSVLEVDFEYPKELCELHYDYPLAPDIREIKREILSKHQLMIADFNKIPIGNVKKLVLNFFEKEKYLFHYENLHYYLRLGLKLKKIHHVLEFDQSRLIKPYVELNIQKRIEAQKNKDKMEKRCTNK